MKKHKLYGFWLVLLLTIVLTGCSLFKTPLTETKTLEGTQRDQVLEYASPKAENLISGLVAADYTLFSTDFSETMKQGMDQAAFEQLLEMFSTKLGTLQSHDVSVVLKDDKFTTIAYKMVFEKDDAVVMRVVFSNEDPDKIDGLWFDSPELRKQ